MIIDPETSVKVIGGGLAFLGSKDLLTKILGPSADYVGGELRNFVEKCNVNLDNIFGKAAKKLGDRMDEEGIVNPRVLKEVIDEGRFCEDELTAEYYGGVLASSKSGVARDDRGVAVLAKLKSLSVYQLRAHYIIYSLIQKTSKGNGMNLGESENMAKLQSFIEWPVFLTAMELSPEEDRRTILTHSLNGLFRHGLLNSYCYGDAATMKEQHNGLSCSGVIASPNLYGAELFMWGMGVSQASGLNLLTSDIQPLAEVPLLGEAVCLATLKRT